MPTATGGRWSVVGGQETATGGQWSVVGGQETATGGQWSVVYVGSADGMEAGLVAQESALPFRPIPAAAVLGRGPLELLRSALTIGRGVLVAYRLIRELRPAALLGTGGYVCVPLFIAARLARVPSVIYLPDVVPGLAVRTIAKLADVVACNVIDSQRYLGVGDDRRPDGDSAAAVGGQRSAVVRRRVVVTGYPVRPELFSQDRAACRAAFGLAEGLPTLLVYGGSRGARSLNRAIAALLPELLALTQIIHVCGREGDAAFLQAALAQAPAALRERYRLFPYLHAGGAASMTAAFGAVDLAVCRSGASTLAELPAAGLPAILVPLPIAGVHQGENAAFLAERGAALVVEDSAMLGREKPTDGALFRAIRRLLVQPEERMRMAERSRALARPDAADHLADVLLSLATGGDTR